MEISVLSKMAEFDHEQVVFFQDKSVGLKAIVAIHNTVLGPALGGTRMWNYATEEEALRDALRLSQGMTYKAAAAGLSLGGGKAVIIGDPKTMKSEPLFRAYGRFINTLGGRYITAEDVGIDINDVEYMYKETDYCVGIESSHGGSGDPSPYTALGTFQGIKACLQKVYGDEKLEGRVVAIQGVGAVGAKLAAMCKKEGATLYISDINPEKVKAVAAEVGAEVLSPEAILSVKCDVLAPCALGAVLNDTTIPKLNCQIVAGAANNQLDTLDHADQLLKKNILYAPDYVINAGGLMNVYLEIEGYNVERAERMTRGIYYNLMNIFDISAEKKLSTARAARILVEDRLQKLGRTGNIYTPQRKDVLDSLRKRRQG